MTPEVAYLIIPLLLILPQLAYVTSGRLLYLSSAPLVNSKGCNGRSKCPTTTSLMVSVLRDPRLLPTWNREAWQRAIAQMQAYQDLFSNGEGGGKLQ